MTKVLVWFFKLTNTSSSILSSYLFTCQKTVTRLLINFLFNIVSLSIIIISFYMENPLLLFYLNIILLLPRLELCIRKYIYFSDFTIYKIRSLNIWEWRIWHYAIFYGEKKIKEQIKTYPNRKIILGIIFENKLKECETLTECLVHEMKEYNSFSTRLDTLSFIRFLSPRNVYSIYLVLRNSHSVSKPRE